MNKEEIETLLHNYNSAKKIIEDLQKEKKERRKQIDELFKPVVIKARDLLVMYSMIGFAGVFGTQIIRNLIDRYESGERTYSLYKQLEELE
jgi:F0F1-type ATP synthase gamma subunit